MSVNAEWEIDDEASYEDFYRAEALAERFGIKFTRKLDGLDCLYWDFVIDGQLFSLHYNIYLGIKLVHWEGELSEGTKQEASRLQEYLRRALSSK